MKMKMKVLFLLILISAQPVFGQVIFTASPSSSTVGLGSTFNVTFAATTTVPFTGFDLFLGTSSADANEFTVTAATLGSQFTYIAGAPSLPANLSTTGVEDFGLTQTPGATNLPAGGPYTLTTLTIEADNGLSFGDHTLTIQSALPDASGVYNADFSPSSISGPVNFTVDVVPEPGTASLLLAGLVGCLLLSPRMRRALRVSGRLPQRISAARS